MPDSYGELRFKFIKEQSALDKFFEYNRSRYRLVRSCTINILIAGLWLILGVINNRVQFGSFSPAFSSGIVLVITATLTCIFFYSSRRLLFGYVKLVIRISQPKENSRYPELLIADSFDSVRSAGR